MMEENRTPLNFDPDGVGVDNGCYFALPFELSAAELALISLPWDVTVSYGDGTALAPQAIIEASSQIDLYDESAPQAWRKGVATVEIDDSIKERSAELRVVAQRVITALESGEAPSKEDIERVNQGSREFNKEVEKQCKELLDKGKIIGIVGGDHSVPYGAICALAAHHSEFGILHIDAHCDLRNAYEGFEHSHASVMYNVLETTPQVKRLVQVGVRDFSHGEKEYSEKWGERVSTWSDYTLSRASFRGTTWHEQCQEIVDKLPQKVYISFDIDGLSIELTPSTGTPVSGGLKFNEAIYLLERVVDSGRTIIGFDMVEVTPQSRVDTIIGVRVLWKLCGISLKSQDAKWRTP